MIVWLSSFPRSGNTFFRIALHRLYRVPTYVVYDVDGVAAQIGTELMDARDRPGTFEEMRASSEVYFVKTHRRRDDPVIEERDRAICLVRDGRDCVVSWARLWTAGSVEESGYADRVAAEARSIITRRGGGTASWGQNVLSWCESAAPRPVWVRFEDLIADPAGVLKSAVSEAVPELQPIEGARVPTFADLRGHDPGFFRAGRAGTHRVELSDELQELFWEQPESAAAMQRFGYRR